MTLQVSFYARVSSEKQMKNCTIDSQILALENRIHVDGYVLPDEFKFIDNGYSGSNIVRPALERLRDKVAAAEIDKIYIHSPDRLARKYVHQMILLEEFQRTNVQVIFLNHETNDSPESSLMLQMQGMIAEYERAKIIERNRRGKIHAAKRGSVSAIGNAPYGYRLTKHTDTSKAMLEIHEQEAAIVRQMFEGIGRDRLTLSEVCRRLNQAHILTQKGKSYWKRAVIAQMLKNPVYKGQAAFGKTKIVPKVARIRPIKNSCEHPKRNHSTIQVEKENWIYISVPSLVDEALYESVQEQLQENRKIARARKCATYLLQGLVVCHQCQCAYSGITRKSSSGTYGYYRCAGNDSHRCGGEKICQNKAVRIDTLEVAIWEEIKCLLKNPTRLLEEFERRLSKLDKPSLGEFYLSLAREKSKIEKGISRLIDSYVQEYIDKSEFEPRIKYMKDRLKMIKEQIQKIAKQEKSKVDIKLIVTNLEKFSSYIHKTLDNLNWNQKREIIRTLVKRIEIDHDDVNVVFRVQDLPHPIGNTDGAANHKNLQHCRRRKKSAAPNGWNTLPTEGQYKLF
jgi:site-specific DNA recombinase